MPTEIMIASEVYPMEKGVLVFDNAGWWNSHLVGARVTSRTEPAPGRRGFLSVGDSGAMISASFVFAPVVD